MSLVVILMPGCGRCGDPPQSLKGGIRISARVRSLWRPTPESVLAPMAETIKISQN